MSIWRRAAIGLTGGTGSFGHAFIRLLLSSEEPAEIRVLSRDELKQSEMDRRFRDPRVRFFLADVRDENRLLALLRGLDILVHAAALKQVPWCDYNPEEAVKTNIGGAMNVIQAATERGVGRVMGLSSDKAAAPATLYGATKLVAEHLFLNANIHSGASSFSVVRYGNVIGSRGSVVPRWIEQRDAGEALELTDDRMTRFAITLSEAASFVKRRVEEMRGGELYIPMLPSVRMKDVAEAIAPNSPLTVTGIRVGEKMHEVLLTVDEAPRATMTYAPEGSYYVVRKTAAAGDVAPYSSDTNLRFLDVEEIRALVPRAMLQAEMS